MLDFKPLKWEDKEIYDRYFNKCPVRCAEYPFFSLWGWRESMPVELAFSKSGGGDLCWIRSQTPYFGIYGPVGDWSDNNINWAEIINNDFNNSAQFFDVPEDAANTITNALKNLASPSSPIQGGCHEVTGGCKDVRFELTEEREQWEYVYSVQDLIKLKGSKFAHKRNRVRTFESSYEWDYMPMKPEDFSEVLDFQERWREHRDESMNESEIASLLGEDLAIRTALENWDKFPLLGGILKVNDNIIAYTIAEELDSENLDVRFEKAFGEYAGSYQAINQFFLRNQGASYKWVNREEDMGEEGLRNAKLSYNPAFMLKKYRIKIN